MREERRDSGILLFAVWSVAGVATHCEVRHGPSSKGGNGGVPLRPELVPCRAIDVGGLVGCTGSHSACSRTSVTNTLRLVASLIARHLHRNSGIRVRNLNFFDISLRSHTIVSGARLEDRSIHFGGIGFQYYRRLGGTLGAVPLAHVGDSNRYTPNVTSQRRLLCHCLSRGSCVAIHSCHCLVKLSSCDTHGSLTTLITSNHLIGKNDHLFTVCALPGRRSANVPRPLIISSGLPK